MQELLEDALLLTDGVKLRGVLVRAVAWLEEGGCGVGRQDSKGAGIGWIGDDYHPLVGVVGRQQGTEDGLRLVEDVSEDVSRCWEEGCLVPLEVHSTIVVEILGAGIEKGGRILPCWLVVSDQIIAITCFF